VVVGLSSSAIMPALALLAACCCNWLCSCSTGEETVFVGVLVVVPVLFDADVFAGVAVAESAVVESPDVESELEPLRPDINDVSEDISGLIADDAIIIGIIIIGSMDDIEDIGSLPEPLDPPDPLLQLESFDPEPDPIPPVRPVMAAPIPAVELLELEQLLLELSAAHATVGIFVEQMLPKLKALIAAIIRYFLICRPPRIRKNQSILTKPKIPSL